MFLLSMSSLVEVHIHHAAPKRLPRALELTMDDHGERGAADYRLTRVEREVAELRAKIESGQGAMLQAVAGVQTQLAQFQITLSADLSNKYVSQREAADQRREVREAIDNNVRRLDKFDQVYIQALDTARLTAETKRSEDTERSLRINLALVTSVVSLLGSTVLHFVKF